jgi:hypothetical protein
LSSTTDPQKGQRGQILVIFTGGLVLILLIAALVFDVGQNLLDRRTEQNAADAAALAGAHHIAAATPYHGGCAAPPAIRAVQAACDVAAANGFVDGSGGKTVRVDIPPIAPSTKAGFPLHIEVTIGSTRPSFFHGILGVTQQRTGAMGVATNGSDIALPVSLLALDPTGCGSNKINGAPGTAVTTNGTVQIDSSCPDKALLLSGNGVLNAPECDVVGGIQTSGGATNGCASAPAGVLAMGDPLRNLPPPPKPGAPANVQPLDSPAGPIPDGCPGGASPATEAAPAICSFSTPAMNGKSYRIFPGYYPGGIAVTRATVYMSPGIYWIGGGGIDVKSTGPSGIYGRLITKALGDDTGLAPSGGVLIYNSKLPNSAYGPIHLNGGDGSTLALRPIETGFYKNMVIYVDRTAATGSGDIDLNGAGSTLDVTGTIYAPTSEVKFNGSDTTVASAQVICFNFTVNGSGSAFTIDYDADNLFHLRGTGLVE